MAAVAFLCALLRLGAIVPDPLAGRPSTSAAGRDRPTDSVHVLDLALFLLPPSRVGYAATPRALPWLGLTNLPIPRAPWVALARGGVPVWFIWSR